MFKDAPPAQFVANLRRPLAAHFHCGECTIFRHCTRMGVETAGKKGASFCALCAAVWDEMEKGAGTLTYFFSPIALCVHRQYVCCGRPAPSGEPDTARWQALS